MTRLTMLLQRYLKLPRLAQRRAEIDVKARELIEKHGDQAYYRARDLARAGRRHSDRKDPTWTKVALRIAKLTKHEIGLTGSDRRPSP